MAQDGIKAGAFGNTNRPAPSTSRNVTARGYEMVENEPSGTPEHWGADVPGVTNAPRASVAPVNRSKDRPVAPHHPEGGLERAARSLRSVGGRPNGGGVRSLGAVPQATPPANGSANPPRKVR